MGFVVPPGAMPSVPIDLHEGAAPLFGFAYPPDDGVQLHVGDRLVADVLEREHDGRHELVHAVFDARIEPAGLDVTGSTSLVIGCWGAAAAGSQKARASVAASRGFDVRAMTILDTGIRDLGVSTVLDFYPFPGLFACEVAIPERRRSLPLIRRMIVIAVSFGSPGTNRRSTLSRAATVSHSSAATPMGAP